MADSRSLSERRNESQVQTTEPVIPQRPEVQGDVRSSPVDRVDEVPDTGEPGLDSEEGAGQGGTDTGVERQGDNQDGDEADDLYS